MSSRWALRSQKSTDESTPRQHKRRLMLRLVCVALLLGWLGVRWWYREPPMVGGGQSADMRAKVALRQVYATIPQAEEIGWTRLDADNPGGWLQSFSEPVQSQPMYQGQNPVRPTAQQRVLVIQPIGTFAPEQQKMLPVLREYAAAFFQLPARVAPPLVLPANVARRAGSAPSETFRNQHRAGDLIEMLRQQRPADAAVYFGVTNVDLYTDGLNFVFGQAAFEQRVGVYSLARYYPEFWNRPRRLGDERRALRRAFQVLNHEIGHILGISHCVFYKCSMNGSNSLGEADAAPIDYCPVCRRKLAWNIGFDEAKRTRELSRFLKRHRLDE